MRLRTILHALQVIFQILTVVRVPLIIAIIASAFLTGPTQTIEVDRAMAQEVYAFDEPGCIAWVSAAFDEELEGIEHQAKHVRQGDGHRECAFRHASSGMDMLGSGQCGLSEHDPCRVSIRRVIAMTLAHCFCVNHVSNAKNFDVQGITS